MNRKFLVPLIGAVFIVAGTIIAIKLGQGYRPDLNHPQTLKGTGLLVANSFPSGAQVFINGNLTTATDTTLNLPPGKYHLEIKKDGLTPWQKDLKLEAELVTQTNATLFPSVPTLKPLTFTGAVHPQPSPNGQKLVYAVTTASTPAQIGLWVIDLNPGTPFLRSQEPRQIARNSEGAEFTTALLTWSPDSTQVLAHFDKINYLLDATRLNDTVNLKDVTASLPLTLSAWEEQLARKQQQQLLTLPQPLQDLALKNATNIYFSPDETKLLYTVKVTDPERSRRATNLVIPDNLIPPLPASSTQTQERNLTPGATYVYDLKEDRNFRVADPLPAELGEPKNPGKLLLIDDLSAPMVTASPSAHTKLQAGRNLTASLAALTAEYTPLPVGSLQWFPDSTHLILNQKDKVIILEYDGLNKATIYSGSFEPNFAYPTATGSQLLLLTNLNQDTKTPPNLYAIDLK